MDCYLILENIFSTIIWVIILSISTSLELMEFILISSYLDKNDFLKYFQKLLLENTKIYSIDIEIIGRNVMPIPHGYINILIKGLFQKVLNSDYINCHNFLFLSLLKSWRKYGIRTHTCRYPRTPVFYH